MRVRRVLAGRSVVTRAVVGVVVELPLVMLAFGHLGWWKLVTIPLLALGTEALVYVGVLDSGWMRTGWFRRP